MRSPSCRPCARRRSADAACAARPSNCARPHHATGVAAASTITCPLTAVVQTLAADRPQEPASTVVAESTSLALRPDGVVAGPACTPPHARPHACHMQVPSAALCIQLPPSCAGAPLDDANGRGRGRGRPAAASGRGRPAAASELLRSRLGSRCAATWAKMDQDSMGKVAAALKVWQDAVNAVQPGVAPGADA